MIKVDNLTQVYKSGKGIFDVSFGVAEGEVFGYLGPNGAGKTTTIRGLMGFANAESGSAVVNGLECRKNAAELQKMVGYLPGEMNMLDYMTGNEFLKFLGEMRGMKDTSRKEELIKRFDLDASGKIKKMSKGMKQKIGIIAAFMHDPKVYILDEPTSGLDPLMQNVFMELIKEEKSRGKTILMSSHIFEEVQRSCDRVGIIKDGRIVTIQNIGDLDSVNTKTFVVTLGKKKDMKLIEDSKFDTQKVGETKVKISASYPFNDFYALLSKCDVKSLEVEHITLENMFMKYYENEEA
ncbi:MAG: ABC transporter ATP-binding protein [Eubacteriales bacterium]